MIKRLGALVVFFVASLMAESQQSVQQMPPQGYTAFVIVVPSYNNNKNLFKGEPAYRKNLQSIFEQTYPYYRVVYIDDCSSDGTAQAVAQMVAQCGQEHRFTLIENKTNYGQLANRYYAIHSCADYEVVVNLDGDDFLANPHVLSYLNKVYQNSDVWMTYGQMLRCCDDCEVRDEPYYFKWKPDCCHPEYDSSICMPLPPADYIARNAWREYITHHRPGSSWVFGALRTFYAGLFKKIRLQDLKKDTDFYVIGEDIATTVYMVELAGFHVAFLPEITYLYNWNSMRTKRTTDHDRPTFWLQEMVRKPVYEPLKNLFDTAPSQALDDAVRFYIERSCQEYQAKDFWGCIRSCEYALKLRPDSACAYSNICSAYGELGLWKRAVHAGYLATLFDPHFDRAKNNYQYACSMLAAQS